MSILFFDTETTGLPLNNMRLDHPGQPHIVQLAAVLTDDEMNEMASINLIVNPGVPIPPGASAVHGISNEIAAKHGILPRTAAILFAEMMENAEVLVAHNLQFDIKMMQTLMVRQQVSVKNPPSMRYCTMESASPIVNLPPTARMIAAGFNKPKPPKLEECIKFFFNETLEGAHDALVDVRACVRVYKELINRDPR